MKIIGIIGAMHEEIELLISEMGKVRIENIAGMEFNIGEISGENVVVVEGGIGKVNSAVCATILINKYNATEIIFTGVAGGIANDIEVGDIVIGKELIQHDFDTTAFGTAPGQIPRMDEYIFKANSKLVELAYECALNVKGVNSGVRIGRVLSGDQFISSIDKIAEMRKTFGGDCVEMEGAAVAQVCHLFKKPFVVIRAVSDKADHSAVVDFPTFVKMAAINSKKIVLEMLKKI